MRPRSGLRSTAARGASTAARICDVANFEEALVPEILQSHYCGSLFANTCAHCSAYRWPHDRETFCCKKGTVRVEPVPPPPNDMRSLFDSTPSGQSFLNSVRAYSNALALASLGCKEVQTSGFNPTFTIEGKLSHRIGSLLPHKNEHPKFAQLFFHNTENQVQNRVSHLTNLDPDVVGQLQNTRHEHNSYVQAFKSAIEITRLHDVQLILHADKCMKPSNEHGRRYNLPVSSEVAALVPGDCWQS